jgi:hypothetical protein
MSIIIINVKYVVLSVQIIQIIRNIPSTIVRPDIKIRVVFWQLMFTLSWVVTAINNGEW